jgi:hypothetical protein
MTNQRKTCGAEFRIEALRLLATSDRSASQPEQGSGIDGRCLREGEKERETEGSQAFYAWRNRLARRDIANRERKATIRQMREGKQSGLRQPSRLSRTAEDGSAM